MGHQGSAGHAAVAVEVHQHFALSLEDLGLKSILIQFLGLPVIAIYENGEMIDSCVKEDATAENVEAMIKKYA